MNTTQQRENTDTRQQTESEAEAATEPLPIDQVFEILKNSRRREVLRYLDDGEGNVSLSDMAEHVAAIENDTTVRELSSTQRKRVYVGLYQSHLPKMDDVGVVNFDQNRGRIELENSADQLYEYLDGESRDDGWHRYYMTVSLVSVGLFGTSQAGAAIVGLTPMGVLVMLLFATLTVSLLHYCSKNGYAVRSLEKLPRFPQSSEKE